MDHLVLLYRYHHRLAHEGGYSVRTSANGPKFADPTGRTVSPAVALAIFIPSRH